MKIQIKNRFTGKVIFEVEALNIKIAVELAVKQGSDLRGSNLSYSDLRGSNLRGSNLSCSDLRGSNLRGSNLSYSDLRGSNLRGSNLSCSDLRGSNLSCSDLSGSNLSYSDLRGSDLSCSNLRGSKNYSESHSFFKEIIRRQKTDTFTDREWCAIGQIIIYTLCWDSIKNRFADCMGSIFDKLAKAGFDEFKKKWEEILNETT